MTTGYLLFAARSHYPGVSLTGTRTVIQAYVRREPRPHIPLPRSAEAQLMLSMIMIMRAGARDR